MGAYDYNVIGVILNDLIEALGVTPHDKNYVILLLLLVLFRRNVEDNRVTPQDIVTNVMNSIGKFQSYLPLC